MCCRSTPPSSTFRISSTKRLPTPASRTRACGWSPDSTTTICGILRRKRKKHWPPWSRSRSRSTGSCPGDLQALPDLQRNLSEHAARGHALVRLDCVVERKLLGYRNLKILDRLHRLVELQHLLGLRLEDRIVRRDRDAGA